MFYDFAPHVFGGMFCAHKLVTLRLCCVQCDIYCYVRLFICRCQSLKIDYIIYVLPDASVHDIKLVRASVQNIIF